MAPTRTHEREVLATIAEKAREKLPQAVNGRLEAAVALVLAGDVHPNEDSTVTVSSATDATRRYVLQGVTCTCTDYVQQKAPEGWCKHRIAAGLHKRLTQVLASEAPPAEPLEAPRGSLPEAPASVNVRVLVAGHEVQWTLRGTDEAEVFARLQALLARKDVQPLPKPAPRSKPHGASQNGHQHIRRDFR
jgi:hypothetical protein